MIRQIEIDKCYQFLLVTLAFLLPLTVAGANITIGVIGVLWFFSGDYKNKLNSILGNKLSVASIVFFFVHVLGLLWTEDIDWGLHMVKKMWHFLLLLPILLTITKREYVEYYLLGFLVAMCASELLSYLVWFEIIDPFKNATVQNPTPFMSHISYNPFLTIAIYLVCHRILFNKNIKNITLCIACFFVITMTINMFITGGRAGQVMFFVALGILIFQYFKGSRVKSFFITLVAIPLIFMIAYNSSSIFNQRVDQAISGITGYAEHLDNDGKSSIGIRLLYAENTLRIIKDHPLIGVGTGDFPSEYERVNMLYHPQVNMLTVHPHNMYLLVFAQLGIVGLISLLSIFYYQIKIALSSTTPFNKNFGIALPLLFLVIMWSDAYLLGHYTTTLFVFMSSFLYKTYEEA